MDNKESTAEIEYRLSKWIIANLQHQGLLNQEEAAIITQLLIKEYNPICSCLETVVMPDE